MSQFVAMKVTVEATVKVEIANDGVVTSELTEDIIDEFDDAFTTAFGNLEGWTNRGEITVDATTVDGSDVEVDLQIVEILDGPNVEVGSITELEGSNA